jgi:hypothetical protein
MARFVYQLKAEGDSRAGFGFRKYYSKTVFASRESAEERYEKFRLMVCDPERLTALFDDERLVISTVQLEVVE